MQVPHVPEVQLVGILTPQSIANSHIVCSETNVVWPSNFTPRKKGYAIKVPVFSFNKFPNVNKELGPEMKSTGESIYFIDDLMDDYFLKVYSERKLYLSK